MLIKFKTILFSFFVVNSQLFDVLSMVMNNAETIKSFLSSADLFSDFKKSSTLSELTKGYTGHQPNRTCFKLVKKLFSSNVSFPTNSTKSTLINSIDFLLQIDELIDINSDPQIYWECFKFIQTMKDNPEFSPQFLTKIVQNFNQTKDLVYSGESQFVSSMIMDYFMKDYEDMGKTIKGVVDKINEFETKEDFDYKSTFNFNDTFQEFTKIINDEKTLESIEKMIK